LPIANCRLPIGLSRRKNHFTQNASTPIGDRQLAIGNGLAVAEGFEPSHGRINSAVPYQLGYATKMVAGAGVEPAGFGL
jgi:hypothetical protein